MQRVDGELFALAVRGKRTPSHAANAEDAIDAPFASKHRSEARLGSPDNPVIIVRPHGVIATQRPM